MNVGTASPVQSQTVVSKTESKSHASLLRRPKMGRPARKPKLDVPQRALLPSLPAGVVKSTNRSRHNNEHRPDFQRLIKSLPEPPGSREDNPHVTTVQEPRPGGRPSENNVSVFRPPAASINNNRLLETPPPPRRESDSPVPAPTVLPNALNPPDMLGSLDSAPPATRPVAVYDVVHDVEILLPCPRGTRQVKGPVVNPESNATLASQSFVQSLGMMEQDRPCTPNTENTFLQRPWHAGIVELIVIVLNPEGKKMIKSGPAVVLPDAYFGDLEPKLILGQDHCSDMTSDPFTSQGICGSGDSGPAQWSMLGALNPLTFGPSKTHGAIDSAAIGEAFPYDFGLGFQADDELALGPDDFD